MLCTEYTEYETLIFLFRTLLKYCYMYTLYFIISRVICKHSVSCGNVYTIKHC